MKALLTIFLFFAGSLAWTQDAADIIEGEWRMELRIPRTTEVELKQRDIALFVNAKMPDGTYRVLTHFTTDAVAREVDQLARPECRGKKACTYDDGAEGIGRLVGNKFYIDWLDEGWIDDVLTVTGNRMSGDDGNGPLDFTKVE